MILFVFPPLIYAATIVVSQEVSHRVSTQSLTGCAHTAWSQDILSHTCRIKRGKEEKDLVSTSARGQDVVLPGNSQCHSHLSSPVLLRSPLQLRSHSTDTPARQPIGSSLAGAPGILLQLLICYLLQGTG